MTHFKTGDRELKYFDDVEATDDAEWEGRLAIGKYLFTDPMGLHWVLKAGDSTEAMAWKHVRPIKKDAREELKTELTAHFWGTEVPREASELVKRIMPFIDKYVTTLIGEQKEHPEYSELITHNRKLKEALLDIAEWRLPDTGKFWDEEKTRPMSYEAAYGSNGARDYIRNIASTVLTNLAPSKKANQH